jgi:hypothetical protein
VPSSTAASALILVGEDGRIEQALLLPPRFSRLSRPARRDLSETGADVRLYMRGRASGVAHDGCCGRGHDALPDRQLAPS